MTHKIVIALLFLALASCSKEETPKALPTTTAAPVKPTSMNVDLLRAAPEEALANELVTYEPVEGHHFETKAPQACGEFEPVKKTARQVVCQFTEPGGHTVRLNICDDEKKYCKPVRYELATTAPKGFVADGEVSKVRQPPKKQHGVAGFVVNDPDAARQRAKEEGKLLFVHFFGIWCPPCNMLEEYVYTKPEFTEATDGMVRVMLDADSDLSWTWKSHFKVGGYPTVVIATAELEEIDRIVGSRPAAVVVEWAKQAEANRAAPIAKLLNQHDAPDAAPAPVRERIGEYFAARREYEEAVRWFDGVDDPDVRLSALQAQKEIAKENGDQSEVTRLTQILVADFADHVKYSSWVEELLEAEVAGVEELVEPALQNLAKWKASDELADTGYSVADIWWKQADLLAASGDEEGAKKAYLESAAAYAEQAEASSLAVARGANMERAYALHKAGDNEAAKKLYTELASAYPEEFSFNYNFAYVLQELGEFEPAYEYAKKAEAHSYGDNWLRAVYLRAKIEDALGQSDQAKKTIDGALTEAVVPRTTQVRTHRYISRLRKLHDEIAAP